MTHADIGTTLPPEIGNLVRLETLNLNIAPKGFQDTGVGTMGTLPTELGNLERLEILILAGSKFNGTLPSEVGNLHNLRKIDLQYTLLTGVIPSEVANLPNFEALAYLDENAFNNNGVPMDYFNGFTCTQGQYLRSEGLGYRCEGCAFGSFMDLTIHIQQSCFNCAKYATTHGNEATNAGACHCPIFNGIETTPPSGGAHDANAVCQCPEGKLH